MLESTKFKTKIGLLLLVIFIPFILSGCFPESEDSETEFDAEVRLETLEGRLFPFSVSIPTSATHRLEKNEILQGYLASNIVDLPAFENLEVTVEGVWKKEKMRRIFWVQKIELESGNKELTPDPEAQRVQTQIFEGPHFSFLYPTDWDYTVGPNETLYFVDKTDSERKVFLTFSLKNTPKEKPLKTPILDENIATETEVSKPRVNLEIGEMQGFKKILHETPNAIQESLVLYSNIAKKDYHFSFNRSKSDRPREIQFEALLNHFVEGESAMKRQKSSYLKALAEEAKKNIPEPEIEGNTTSEETQATDNETSDLELDIKSSESKAEEPVIAEDRNKDKKEALIDARASVYQNSHHDLYLKVPYGYWYRNFGAKEGAKITISFSDEPFQNFSQAKFKLSVFSGQSVEEKDNRGIMMLDFLKDEGHFYRFEGPERFLPVMEVMKDFLEK